MMAPRWHMGPAVVMVLAIAPALLFAAARNEPKPPADAAGLIGARPDAASLAGYMLKSDVVALGELKSIDSLPTEQVMPEGGEAQVPKQLSHGYLSHSGSPARVCP